ncbi:MAG: 5-formyltetrahydrofolate cyclo-ligase [Acholeplasmataceae bacterium]|nr:5-formyltetrahydrofolate cyclo-ligase [Acholeplasmataceae bacterium]
MTKQGIRSLMFQKRNEASLEDLKKGSQEIINRIQNDANYQKALTVAVFYPMEREVNLLGLINSNQTFCFPKVTKEGLHFYKYTENQEFLKSKFGVMEPVSGEIVDDQIDYMCTPALAISKSLYRIGYGKGYYDAFLTKHRPKHVVGVIFDFQELEDLPYDSLDQKLDYYIKG